MDFDYHILVEYYPVLLQGLLLTVVILLISLGSGFVLGLVACFGSMRKRGIIYRLTRAYVDFFRTTPEMAIIFWFYFCLPPILNVRMSAMTSGTLALSLVAGAFMSEIFRAGVEAIARGQVEAARALGIPVFYRWRRIFFPQAMRRMMPALINYLTELLKLTTLLSAIAVHELAYKAYSLGSQTYRYVELLSAIAVVYFLLITPISLLARYSEKVMLRKRGH